MTPAQMSIKAKTEPMWDAVSSFVEWLIRAEKLTNKVVYLNGIGFNTDTETAERIHMAVSHHRLPVIVDLKVKGYH